MMKEQEEGLAPINVIRVGRGPPETTTDHHPGQEVGHDKHVRHAEVVLSNRQVILVVATWMDILD